MAASGRDAIVRLLAGIQGGLAGGDEAAEEPDSSLQQAPPATPAAPAVLQTQPTSTQAQQQMQYVEGSGNGEQEGANADAAVVHERLGSAARSYTRTAVFASNLVFAAAPGELQIVVWGSARDAKDAARGGGKVGCQPCVG